MNITTIKDAIDLARRAFESDEVAMFLCGEKNYAVPISRFVSANVPTDFEYIIRVCLYGYFKECNDDSIPDKYTLAIRQLLEGDYVNVWCAYMVCFFQIGFEYRNKSPFKIMSQDMITWVSHMLHKNKEGLKSCYLWQGKERKEGLWQEIEATNRVLSKEYGVSLL